MRKWLTPEREAMIVELYERYENAREVAADMGCSMETVYRALKKHGVKRTHRHDDEAKPKAKPKVKISHCRSKYCPALITILFKSFGWGAVQIAEATGYKPQGIRKVLVKRGLVERKVAPKNKLDLDQIEHEYVDLGMTSSALGKKYGVNPGSISKWMRERGIWLGRGAHQEGRKGRSKADGDFVYTEHMREVNKRKHDEAESRFAERLHERFGGRLEYVGGFRCDGTHRATIRCTRCGHEFVHGTTEIGNSSKEWKCPSCEEQERRRREAEQDAERYRRLFDDFLEFAVQKTCPVCGGTFQSSSKGKRYCSVECRQKAHDAKRGSSGNFRSYYRHKYGDRYLEHYDPSVTLERLYERDGGVCQICGRPCDWDDVAWGSSGPNHPSIDHIVPRSGGGDHFWSNVQLAHCMCNSCKRDIPNDVAIREAACA